MVVPYNPQSSSDFYCNYYSQQVGNGLSVFKGTTIQRGRGIGSFFSRMMRGAMPLLKSGAKAVGKQIVESGANIAKDLIEGKNLKASAIKNLSAGGSKLMSGLTNVFDERKSSNRKRKINKAKKSAKKSNNPHKK